MSFFQSNRIFGKVYDSSIFQVQDPLVKVNTLAKGSNLILGSSAFDETNSSLIYIGKMLENSTGKNYLANDLWLDVKFPHVIYITGTRGSGKSFDLGVLLEGISDLHDPSNVQYNVSSTCSFLIDTQSQFWTLKYPPNPNIPANQHQLADLNKWELSSNSLENCQLWYVSDKDRITGTERKFQIRPQLVRHEEWCEILDEDVYGPQGYALARAIEAQNGSNFSLADLITFVRDPSNLLGIQPSSKSALIYKLEEYDHSDLFNTAGIEISDLLIKGQCNVFLLRDCRDIDKSLVTCVLARQLFTFMGEYHKQKKVNTFFDKAVSANNIPDKVWLVIDEAHIVAPNDANLPARKPLVEYVKRGRDAGLSLVLATQQPSAIDDRILSQVNISFSHRLAFQSDIQAAINRIPAQLLKKMKVSGAEFADFGEMIRFLDAGQCFIGDNSTSRTILAQIRPRITAHGGYSPI
jgi:hypothetical protein